MGINRFLYSMEAINLSIITIAAVLIITIIAIAFISSDDD